MGHTIDECIAVMNYCDGTMGGNRCEGCPAYIGTNCRRGGYDKEIKQYLNEYKAMQDGFADGEQVRKLIEDYNKETAPQVEAAVRERKIIDFIENSDFKTAPIQQRGHQNVVEIPLIIAVDLNEIIDYSSPRADDIAKSELNLRQHHQH